MQADLTEVNARSAFEASGCRSRFWPALPRCRSPRRSERSRLAGPAVPPAFTRRERDGGIHVATGTAATSGGSGGGGTLGCAGGSSATMLHGLTTTTSGRVVEAGARIAARSETHARTATTRSTNVSAHLRTVGHHA